MMFSDNSLVSFSYITEITRDISHKFYFTMYQSLLNESMLYDCSCLTKRNVTIFAQSKKRKRNILCNDVVKNYFNI